MSKEQARQDAEFAIVIESAKDSRLADATGAFSKVFNLDGKVAEQILKSAPIVFLSKLSKQDMRVLKPKLVELSNHGIEFRLTARPADRVPKVNWPIRPSFGTGDGGSLVTTVSFIWDNNAFVCPGCGETFVFRRVGKPKPAVGAAAAIAAAAKAAPAPAAPAAKPAPVPAKPAAPPARPAAPAKPAPKTLVDDDDLGTVDLLDEVPTLDLDDVAPLDSPDMLEEAPPLDDIEAVEELEAIEEVPKPAPKKPAGPPPRGPVKPGGMIRPMVKLEEVDEVDEVEAEDLASVFLNRIPAAKDQEVAAKIIAEVRSCPMKEAKELAARMVIPVVKDVPLKEAESILAKFQKAKIPGRLTKKK